MPDIIVIAGPNGAGKSTLAPHLLRDAFGILEYVNADTIAQGLSAFAPENAAFEAGRIMLRRLNELAEQRRDFAFETTLATRFYCNWLQNLQRNDYNVHLVFLWLEDVELAFKRVEERVGLGGHDVPKNTISRRYRRGLRNFFNIYKPFVDSWQFFDASTFAPREIAFGDKIGGEIIQDKTLWPQIEK